MQQLLDALTLKADEPVPRSVLVTGTSELICGGQGLGVAAVLAEAGDLGRDVSSIDRILVDGGLVCLRARGRRRALDASLASWTCEGLRWPGHDPGPDLWLMASPGPPLPTVRRLLDMVDRVALFVDGSAVSSGISDTIGLPMWPLLRDRASGIIPCVHCANFFSRDALPSLYQAVYLELCSRFGLPGHPGAFFLSQNRNPGYQALFLLQSRRHDNIQPPSLDEAFRFLRRNGLRQDGLSSSVFHADSVEELVDQICQGPAVGLVPDGQGGH